MESASFFQCKSGNGVRCASFAHTHTSTHLLPRLPRLHIAPRIGQSKFWDAEQMATSRSNSRLHRRRTTLTASIQLELSRPNCVQSLEKAILDSRSKRSLVKAHSESYSKQPPPTAAKLQSSLCALTDTRRCITSWHLIMRCCTCLPTRNTSHFSSCRKAYSRSSVHYKMTS